MTFSLAVFFRSRKTAILEEIASSCESLRESTKISPISSFSIPLPSFLEFLFHFNELFIEIYYTILPKKSNKKISKKRIRNWKLSPCGGSP